MVTANVMNHHQAPDRAELVIPNPNPDLPQTHSSQVQIIVP
jgi:hypothetical protein